jgi:hypothetical protein
MVINWPARSAPASNPEEKLETDKLELKAQIRTALADLATRHGIAEVEVDQVMWAYIDNAVRDLTFTHERGLTPPTAEEPARSATVCAFVRPPLNS